MAATGLLGKAAKPRRSGGAFATIDFWVVLFVPFTLFVATLCAWNYLLFYFFNNVVIGTIAGLILCGLAVLFRTRGVLNMRIGVTGLLAILCGAFMGLYCYDTSGIFMFLYANSRKYTNVVASEASAGVADAGRLVFSAEASVDGTQSVGFQAANGNTYCVAPIRAQNSQAQEFWAVGVNCCGWESDFNCDAATDNSARGGIVVFDTPGIFAKSNKDFYDQARSKAEAEFALTSADKPMYVRWVKDDNLDMLNSHYKKQSAIFICLVSIGYFGLSVVLSKVLWVDRAQMQQLP